MDIILYNKLRNYKKNKKTSHKLPDKILYMNKSKVVLIKYGNPHPQSMVAYYFKTIFFSFFKIKFGAKNDFHGDWGLGQEMDIDIQPSVQETIWYNPRSIILIFFKKKLILFHSLKKVKN